MKAFDRAVAVAVLVVTTTAFAACGDEAVDDGAPDTSGAPATDTTDDRVSATTANDTDDDRFPDVIGATATETSTGVWRFDATLSSPYDTPERYADAWRVVGDDGVVYGVRELTHDHASEQPFTRSLSGVEIPDTVSVVTIEGRDQANGWGGAIAEVVLQP